MTTTDTSAGPADIISPRFRGPIWTLLFLSPIIAEVLSGATRTTVLFVLIPEVLCWGIGALLCRELVRRWRGGGTSLLLLGFALSIAEEFLIQQTSIAPLPWAGSHPDYGRLWGVNLLYLLFMLGYESVFVVVIPVQVTELIFPSRREQPWLRRGGWIACVIGFLVGCRIAWYGWTQQARPRMGAAPYHPPIELLAAGLGAIVMLVAMAYLARNVGRQARQGRTVPAWLAAVVAFVMTIAWFQVIAQIFYPHPIEPFWVVLGAGAVLAALAYLLFTWWSSRAGWSDVHRFWTCFGAVFACQAGPYATMASWPRIDIIGKAVFDVAALIGFALLGREVLHKREQQSTHHEDGAITNA